VATNEPSGIEVFRTLAKLGLDVQPAITSSQSLAEQLKLLDTSLQHLINTAKTAPKDLNRIFGVELQQKSLRQTIKVMQDATKNIETLLKMSQDKQYASLSASEIKRLALIEQSRKKELQIVEQHMQTLRHKEETHRQTLKQRAERHAREMQAIELKRRGSQTPMGEAFTYRTSWFISGTLFYGSIRGAQALVSAVADVEDIMIGLRKVMDESQTDFDALQNEIFDTAQAYGFLVQKVGEAAVEWGRQGRTQKEIQELLRPTMLLTNIAEIENTADAVRYLTAATKQFKLEASDAMRVTDIWNEVSNNFAVTAKDLAEAISVGGSVAHTVGVSIEQMVGHITALSEATGKEGKAIGQSLKTIYAYMLRPETIKTLEEYGFKVHEDVDNYRALTDILADLAKEWDHLTEKEQYAIAMKAAGVRRISDFIALLRNHNRAVEATITAMASMGSAERENEKQMESYRKQLQQLYATVQEVAVEMGEAGLIDTLKGVASGTKLAVENFKQWNPVLRGTVEVVGMLTAALTALNMGWSFFAGKTFIQSLAAGGTLTKFLATASAVLHSPVGAGALLAGGAIYGVSAIVASIQQQRDEAGKLAKRLEENYEAYKNITEILAGAEKGTVEYTTASKSLNDILGRFANLAPSVISKWDDMGRAVALNTEELEKFIEAQREFAGLTVSDLRKRFEEADAAYKKHLETREQYVKFWTQPPPELGIVPKAELDVLREWNREAERLYKERERLRAEYETARIPLDKARWSAYTAAFGGAQTPKWYDAATGQWVTGMFPYRTERHFEGELEPWPALEKTLPVIAKAEETVKKLEQTQRALTLQHERELALLPTYANAIEETNIKIKQNAELIKQNQIALAAVTKERDAVKKALDAETDAFNKARDAYNALTKEQREKGEGDELEKKLREHEKNVSNLKSKYESLDKAVTDYGNNAISLTTDGIKLDKQRNKLLDEYNESLKKARRTLEDMMGVQRDLADIQFAKQWAEFWGNDEQVGLLTIAELRKQLEGTRIEAKRILEDIDAAQDKGEFGTFDDAIARMVALAEKEVAIHQAIALEEAKISKDRVDREKKADEKILESRRLAREKDIQEQINALNVQLSLTEEGTKAYIELQNKLDELTIRQKEIEKERLYAHLVEGISPKEAASIILELSKLEGEIESIRLGISNRTAQWQKKQAEQIASLTLDLLKETEPLEGALKEAEQKVKKLYKEIPDREEEETQRLAIERGKVFRDYYEKWANEIVKATDIELPTKVELLSTKIGELVAKGLEGKAAVEALTPMLDELVKNLLEEGAKYLEGRERALGRGFFVDIQKILSEKISPEEQMQKIRGAYERAISEDLGQIFDNVTLAVDQRAEEVLKVAEKFRPFAGLFPDIFARIDKTYRDTIAKLEVEPWESTLAKPIPIIQKMDKLFENLAKSERVLGLEHARQLALLPLYATELDKVNLELQQNAERIEEAKKRQSALVAAKGELQTALDEEIKRNKEIKDYGEDIEASIKRLGDQVTPAWNRELEDAKKQFSESEKKIASIKETIETVDKQLEDAGNTIIELGTDAIELGKQYNKLFAERQVLLAESDLEALARAVQEEEKALTKFKTSTEGLTRTMAILSQEQGIHRRILAALSAEYEALSLQVDKNLDRLGGARALTAIRQGGSALVEFRESLKGTDLIPLLDSTIKLVEQMDSVDLALVQTRGNVDSLGREIEELGTQQRMALEKAGLEDFAQKVADAKREFEDFKNVTADQAKTVALLAQEQERQQKILKATEDEYVAIKARIEEYAQRLGEGALQRLFGTQEELAAWRQELVNVQSPLLDIFDEAVALVKMLPDMESAIIRLQATINALGKEITLLPIQEKFAALNSSLEEFSRFITQAALAEEYFAEGLLADVKRMELQRQKLRATKEVAEAYKDALAATTAKLRELLPEDAALFDAIAAGIPLTKEQADRFGELNVQLDKLPKEVGILLPLLTSLRDKNGELSKSIMDSAFSLYRATLAAKGLAEAYDAILSGAKELKDTFDYRKELRGLEERYNYNYIFGRPAERAMEDWQAEFDDIKRDMEAIAKISAGLRVLQNTEEDEKALARLKQELKEIAEKQPAFGITPEQIDALGKDIPEAMNLAATAAGNLEGRLESLVSKRYFLELAREAEEMGRSFEQNIEGAFERAISDAIKGEGDLLNILVAFGQNIVGNMADMLAKGLTRRVFGDPNDPNSLAGRITAWATGKAGDTLGIQTSMTTGAQVAGNTMQTAIVIGGQQVASMWSAVLRTAPIGTPGVGGIPGIPSGAPSNIGSIAGWRMLENASMAGGLSGSDIGSVAGWRILENASMAGLGATKSGGFLAALKGFNWPLAIGTFAIGTLLQNLSRRASMPIAPEAKDQYYYKIYTSAFNPFASPERTYFSGRGREVTEVTTLNFQEGAIVVNAKDGTDAGRKMWTEIKRLSKSGSWGSR
jgi:TP901 family phage tail tape measure protein